MSSTAWYLNLSLLRGWLPAFVDVVAWTALVASVAWLRRPPWHWVVIAGAAGVGALGLAHLIDAPSRFGSTYPRSFLAWGALPLFGAGAGALQWRHVGWVRRAMGLVSIPAMAVFAGMQINMHYGYLPTVGDLVGAPLPGQVDPARLLTPSRPRELGSVAGAVAHLDLPAPTSKFEHRSGWVWVPPVYFSVPRPRLPVLMLISGTPGRPDDWLRAGGALALANRWADDHHGVAPVMVLPDANGSGTRDTECVNSPRGQAETYLTVDVPRFMIEHFGVAESPRQWAVAGLSEGGTCALMLAARHPDRFSSFADFSGDPAPTLGSDARTIRDLYNGSIGAWRAHDPVRWFAKDASMGVEGYFAIGRSNHHDLESLTSLATHARAAHMRIVTDLLPGGGHDWYTWKRALRNAYPWLVNRLGTADRARSASEHGGPKSSAVSTAALGRRVGRRLPVFPVGRPAAGQTHCMTRGGRVLRGVSTRAVLIAVSAVLLGSCIFSTDYPVPGGNPWGTAFDARGGVWVAMPGCDPSPTCSGSTPPGKLALFDPDTHTFTTVVSLPNGFGQPLFVEVDQAGRVWFTMPVTNAIGRYDPNTDAVRQWPIPTVSGGPWDLDIDGNGKIWFTEHYSNKIGSFDPSSQTFAEVSTPAGNSNPYGIAIDAHNNIWFTENPDSVALIGEYTNQRVLREFKIRTGSTAGSGLTPHLITLDLAGNVWWSEGWVSAIGKLNVAAAEPGTNAGVTEYFYTPSCGSCGSHTSGIAADEQGLIWLDDSLQNTFGSFPVGGGAFSFYQSPGNHPHDGLNVDSQNRIWFDEEFSNRLAVAVQSGSSTSSVDR